MQLTLEVVAGSSPGGRWRFGPGETVVGRDPQATIAVPDGMASRHHLKIWVSGGGWLVADLGSANGTFLNGQRLGTEPRALASGAEIRFGAQVWRATLTPGAIGSAGVPPKVGGDGRTACRVCAAPAGLLQRAALQAAGGVCRACAAKQAQALDAFRRAFLGLAHSRPLLTRGDMDEIGNMAGRLGVDLRTAFAPLRAERLALMQRQLTIAKADGVVEPDEVEALRRLQTTLLLDAGEVGHVWADVERTNLLAGIQAGNLTPIRSGLAIPPTEICYHESAATYLKPMRSGLRELPGTLSITDAKLRFVSSATGFDFPIAKVSTVAVSDWQHVHLGLTRQQGAGHYRVPAPDVTAALLNHLLDRHHRRAVVQASGSRSIPPNLRAEVWQRDGGRCVECGEAQYLEFDHVIPFAKGGATSLGNLQLLCRGCNLKKGARI